MNAQSSLKSTLSKLTISAAVFMTASQGLAQSYTVVDLGTLGGEQSSAYDINNAGQITGSSYLGLNPLGYQSSSFLWQDGVMIDIGVHKFPASFGIGRAINNNSQVCGVSSLDNNSNNAFLWQDGVMEALGTLGGTASHAYDINDLGDIAGWANPTGSNVRNAVLWSGGKIIDLGVLAKGFKNSARGINNNQEIVGYGSISNSIPRGFLWRNGEMTLLPMLEGATKSSAYKINDDGVIVGTMKLVEGVRHPIIWITEDFPEVSIIDLGLPEKYSSGSCSNLNNAGQVVGSYLAFCNEEDYCPYPFIWENGEIKMLDDLIPADSDWDLRSVLAINDLGQIVGWGIPPGADTYTYHGFLLNPIIQGDLDGDFTVSTSDLLILLSSWGQCGDCDSCDADLDDNCEVGTSDLLLLLSNWS